MNKLKLAVFFCIVLLSGLSFANSDQFSKTLESKSITTISDLIDFAQSRNIKSQVNKPILMDSRFDKRINLIGDMQFNNKDEIYFYVQNVLTKLSYSLVEKEDYFLVLSNKLARLEQHVNDIDQYSMNIGILKETIELNKVSPKDMVAVLRPVISEYGKIQPDNKSIVVVDYLENINRVKELIHLLEH